MDARALPLSSGNLLLRCLAYVLRKVIETSVALFAQAA